MTLNDLVKACRAESWSRPSRRRLAAGMTLADVPVLLTDRQGDGKVPIAVVLRHDEALIYPFEPLALGLDVDPLAVARLLEERAWNLSAFQAAFVDAFRADDDDELGPDDVIGLGPIDILPTDVTPVGDDG